MDELEQVQQQIAELQKKAEQITKDKKISVIKDVRAKIRAYKIMPKDLGFDSIVEKTKIEGSKVKTQVKVKYRKGDSAWTGRGIQPNWIKKYIAEGGKLEDLLIK
jgi:DNA-binding protein H-NS